MTDKPKPLPPDADQRALAAEVNAKVSGARVDFFRLAHDDYTENCVTFSCGERRTTLHMRGEYTADEIVKSVTDWAAQIAYSARWTEDPGEAA